MIYRKKLVNATQYSFTKYNGSSVMMTKVDSSTREYIGRLNSLSWNREKLTISGYGETSWLINVKC